MAIKVDTQRFELTHGRAPRGYGLWMFQLEGTNHVVSVTDNYTNARAEAKRRFRQTHRVQDGYIFVCP